MNFTEIQKNRLDNEIQEIRDRRNAWLTALISTPLAFLGLGFFIEQGGIAAVFGLLILLFFRSKVKEIQEELKSKMNELRRLEAKYKKKKN